jgi:proteasome lid subunit RPN8/RPN11
VVIPEDIVDQIVAQARRDAPLEICGYLAGRKGRIIRCYPVANDDRAGDRFTFEAEGQLLAVASAEREGLDIMALYHSHPRGAAWPSREDVQLAFDPTLVYLIVGLEAGEVVRAFRIVGGVVDEEPVVIDPGRQGGPEEAPA